VPELPEVETVRRGLDARVVGRRIESVEVGRERTVRRTSAREVIDGLAGTTLVGVDRRGKYLIGRLDSGDAVMIHLRMSGQVLLAEAGATRPPHTHVVLHLGGEPAEELWFVDPRTFGEVVVFDPDHAVVELPELALLGVDPLADGLDAAALGVLLGSRRRQLKALLLDQHVIAGIGNIYADEILHAARLHPDRRSDTLSRAEVGRLDEAIHHVLGEAIGAGGSTLRTSPYVDLMGSGGSYQDDHRVYGRAGLRCTTCGRGIVRRATVNGRGTHWCPLCQRASTGPRRR
jgi:formamidopyrimidine-DNA glycosylase